MNPESGTELRRGGRGEGAEAKSYGKSKMRMRKGPFGPLSLFYIQTVYIEPTVNL